MKRLGSDYADASWSSSQDSFNSTGANYSDTSISTSTTGDTFGFAEFYTQKAPQIAAKRNLRSRKSLKPPPLPPKPRMLEEMEKGRHRHNSHRSTSPIHGGRCGSSLSIQRSASRTSLAELDDSILNASFGSPKANSSPKDDPEDPLYAKIAKRPLPPSLPVIRHGARKRVCFRDAMSLSSIQEASPIALPRAATSSLFPVTAQENLRTAPSPQPFKSPARPQPKTNPHFGGTPRMGSSRGTLGRLSLRSLGGGSLGRTSGELWRQERVSSYYDSDEASWESWSERGSSSQLLPQAASSKPGGSSASLQRVLAGLKSFGIKGEIYVSMVLNRSLLTITVDEGRNFLGPQGIECNSYCRLSLMPDEDKRTQCRTSLVPRSNAPTYNQTFTLEILGEDRDKRLLISVWHRDLTTQKSSLLGCMSFTVKHLMNAQSKPVDGWYFLLAPTYGRHKHLAVEKVNMLTYYGSVDSGLHSDSQSRVVVL